MQNENNLPDNGNQLGDGIFLGVDSPNSPVMYAEQKIDISYTKTRFFGDAIIEYRNELIDEILEKDFEGISLKDGATDNEKSIGKIIYDRIKSRKDENSKV